MAKSLFLLENITAVFRVLTSLVLRVYSGVQLQSKSLFKIKQPQSKSISYSSRKVEELENYLRDVQEGKGFV
jgi:hypothetical protein